jgi:predicted DNA-binding protein
MRGMTIRLPEEYVPRLEALAKREGLKPAEFVRRRLLILIDQEERARHRAAMEEMVRQAVAHGEVRDQALEEAALEALAKEQA